MRLASLLGVVVAAAVLPLSAQTASAPAPTAPEWIQPYSRIPNYWELVGRLFGETSDINRDRSLTNITAPAVIGLATITSPAKPGDTVASLADITFNTNDELAMDVLAPKLVVKEVREVRVILTGKIGIAVEWRSGSSSLEHKQCVEAQTAKRVYLLDTRWRALQACERAVRWSAWQREARLPFAGTFTVDGWTALDVSYDPNRDEIRTSIRNPETTAARP